MSRENFAFSTSYLGWVPLCWNEISETVCHCYLGLPQGHKKTFDFYGQPGCHRYMQLVILTFTFLDGFACNCVTDYCIDVLSVCQHFMGATLWVWDLRNCLPLMPLTLYNDFYRQLECFRCAFNLLFWPFQKVTENLDFLNSYFGQVLLCGNEISEIVPMHVKSRPKVKSDLRWSWSWGKLNGHMASYICISNNLRS